jgi:hypothetical protein
MSKTEEQLEVAAKAETEACKALMKRMPVRTISAKRVEKECWKNGRACGKRVGFGS